MRDPVQVLVLGRIGVGYYCGEPEQDEASAFVGAFKAGGSTTAGNSSQLTDGAAMVLLARRSVAKKLGLPIVARFRSFACATDLEDEGTRIPVLRGGQILFSNLGADDSMGWAETVAGLKVEDIDIYEINEAFASQATMCPGLGEGGRSYHLRMADIEVNPKGGAIALGHPLGATGARQIATLLPELKRQGKKLGVTSMCLGSGMGAASVIELE
eukprot:Skav211665  [mRNA]  locus=scaffold216:25307:30881:+ [translate_table: standard]